MRMKLGASLALVAAVLTTNGLFAAKIEVTQDHADALYRVGEETTFTVSVKDEAGGLVKSGKASWTLDNFGTEKLGGGTADLAQGNPFTIKGRMKEEGFLRLRVSSSTNSVVWGVGYDVGKIRQDEPCPVDFDTYWTAEKARLEREVPLDPKCVRDEKLDTKISECYRVNFATFGGKRVYGFLAVPKNKAKAPFRVRVSVPGAGPGVISLATARDDEMCLTMNVHCFEPEATPAAQRRHMEEQNTELARKFNLVNKEAYCAIAGIAESREDYWYHDVMLGINRAVNWVLARPDADSSRVTYTGSSQGGGFGLILTYLNGRFTRTFVAVCAITGHFGYKQNRKPGWPRLIQSQRPEKQATAERFAPYFDGVNFASRIKSPIRFIVGFADGTCPPADVYAAFNACPSCDKAIINAIGSPHHWSTTYSKMRKANQCIEIDAWLREDTPSCCRE